MFALKTSSNGGHGVWTLLARGSKFQRSLWVRSGGALAGGGGAFDWCCCRAEMPTMSDEWVVEKVLQWKKFRQKDHYLVKWEGYGHA